MSPRNRPDTATEVMDTDRTAHAVLNAFGLAGERLTVTRQPDGTGVLYSVNVPTGEVFAVAERLCEAVRGTGLAAFASCEEPDEWDWLPPGHERLGVVGPPEQDEALIAELVRAVREFDAAYWLRSGSTPEPGWLDPALLAAAVADRIPAAPLSRPPVTGTEPEWIHLVPSRHPWDLPLTLHHPSAANWRASATHPDLLVADHVAVLRSWYHRFGAEISYLGANDIELTVRRPPTTPAEIAAVAIEQWGYCYDLDQTAGFPEHVAVRQVPSDRWYFWWD